jgi:hypothetical protein
LATPEPKTAQYGQQRQCIKIGADLRFRRFPIMPNHRPLALRRREREFESRRGRKVNCLVKCAFLPHLNSDHLPSDTHRVPTSERRGAAFPASAGSLRSALGTASLPWHGEMCRSVTHPPRKQSRSRDAHRRLTGRPQRAHIGMSGSNLIAAPSFTMRTSSFDADAEAQSR